MYLGELIKKYRQEHDLSMQTFADRCGVSKGYIAMLEKNVNSKTGEPVVPSIETFIKVAGAMNIPLAKLVDMVDENQPVNLDRSVHLEEVLGDLADKKFKSQRVNDILNKCTDTDMDFIELYTKLPPEKKAAFFRILKAVEGIE